MHIFISRSIIRGSAPRPARLLHFSGVIAMLLAVAATSIDASPITYYVATSSESNACCDVHGSGSDGKGTYNTNTGATFVISPFTGMATATGSPNVTGLTSSFDQSSASFGTASASSFAAADLSSGSLRVAAAGDGGASGVGEGIASAEIFDTLTFFVAGANSSTITDVGLLYSLDGTSSLGTGEDHINVNTVLGLGSHSTDQGGAQAQFVYDVGFVSGPPAITVNQSGWVSETVLAATPGSFIFQGVTSGQGATFTIPVDLRLNLTCQDSTCDFSHTGLLSLSLPSNVTFTSASGVFLTQGSATPEPTSWTTMMLGGLALVVLAVKRRTAAGLNIRQSGVARPNLFSRS